MKRFTKKINPVLKAFVLFLFILSHVATAAEIYYYHNDHLGTPQVMTDANADIVWQANYTPFGKADIVVEKVTNNIRFPGQYFDEESGLHYNYYRDYDPELGRYIQSDPIGLAGGINTYGYAYQNPVMNYDPDGKKAVSIAVCYAAVEAAGVTATAYGFSQWNSELIQSLERTQKIAEDRMSECDLNTNDGLDQYKDYEYVRDMAKLQIADLRSGSDAATYMAGGIATIALGASCSILAFTPG
jgi:RHS repeat-associated protein